MKKVSIKTVDGSRNEFYVEYGDDFNLAKFDCCRGGSDFVGVPIKDGVKFFNKSHIVSITVTEM